MLKTRIIPTLLWRDSVVVKDLSFRSQRTIGTIIPAVKVYNRRNVDELIIVNIDASKQNLEIDYDIVQEFSEECFMPLTIGGGIKNVDQVRKLLMSGADKISLNSAAYDNPDLIKDIARTFGSQCVVISIDVKKQSQDYLCYSHSATRKTKYEVVQWAKIAEEMGAGEILLTSIELDGSMQGYDSSLISAVSNAVKIPVIASGGCGNYDDMYEAINCGANAVSAASIFSFTEQTPTEAKRYLQGKGVNVRLG